MFDYPSLITHIEEQEFVVERQFSAPRSLMFQVFTQPEHLKRWWAPQPYTIPVCTIDLRPGGIWHYCMRSPEGQDHWARSVYSEIVPPEKLVYSSTFADEHANPIEGIPEHLTTVIFTQETGTTRVAARVQFTNAAALKVAVDMGMLQGMSMTWDYLVGYVQELHQS
ncbi:SRPBCC domain-containing protein [Ktedonobacter racemifer]|uniref:Activator of Hsp90 ATPase 1 family protein n=1 Tax=Ktedonobacter racemifer DSM 44963 TaxID=485913 RepID=D6TNB9_KTERA|nr:SRPBCC domain-containing protein [Ktedonobacter racemifer]EFH85432.1 Activator of Hsp90 ATPase 1 family protein [Ktedonobacter racemifer DSM 44963]